MRLLSDRAWRRVPRGPLVLAALLASCTSGAGAPSARCAAALQRSYPYAEIVVTKLSSAADTREDLNSFTARVEGRISPAPRNRPAEVAAECRFHDDVLTEFRWTQGP
jgi:hypothetical protein